MVSLLAVGRPAAADYAERIISNSRAFDLLVASDGQLYYVDYFGGELGTLDVDTGHQTPLLTGLRSPYHMAEFQNRIYFTEFGTSDAYYGDGALSVFDPKAGTHSRLREGLHAAASIEADSAGNLYVLEVPGTSTSFGGVDRLLKFPNAGGEYDVVIDQMSYVLPLSLLLDEANHRLFIGDGGIISPSNLGSLIAYSLDDGTSQTVLTGLPTVWDMEFDRRGNILVAGFGEDDPGIPLRAVSYIPPTLDQFIPLRTGLDAWTVASDGAGSIYFATGESIRVLSVPVPEPSTFLLFALGLTVVFSLRRAVPNRLVKIAALFPLVALACTARTDIFRWEYINPADHSQGKQKSTLLAPGGAGVDAVPGADLSSRDLTMADFIAIGLQNVNFSSSVLTGADFSSDIRASGVLNTDPPLLTMGDPPSGSSPPILIYFVRFRPTDLAQADFSGAEIRGASFSRGYCPPGFFAEEQPPGESLSLEQLYSTASYHNRDLRGINWTRNPLEGANFANQNLANAVFSQASLANVNFTNAILTNADFSGADLFGVDARGAYEVNFAGGTNLIRPDGHIGGLDLDAGQLLVLRDYDGDSRYEPARPPIPITVDDHLAMGPGGTLRMVFETDAWDSTISFAPGIPVTLGGLLELTFADDVNLPTELGRTFDVFDWTGVNPTGEFDVSSPYTWDLTNLYTTGEVTLVSVPEPSAIVLLVLAFGLTFRLATRSR
jgi:uncharacterized protein YjbI with pentapeptide repeats